LATEKAAEAMMERKKTLLMDMLRRNWEEEQMVLWW
jgi:hypothetical protein